MYFLSNPLNWVIASAVFGLVAAILTARQQEQHRLDLEGWVTGGDSYAVLEPKQTPMGGVEYFLRHMGKYPVQNIHVKVYVKDDHLYTEHQEAVLTGNHQWRHVFSIKPPGAIDSEIKYGVEIAALRGVVVQHLRLVPSEGKWLTYSKKVERDGKPVPLPHDFTREGLDS